MKPRVKVQNSVRSIDPQNVGNKLMEVQNEYNEEILELKEKLHKKESQLKEVAMEDEYAKAEQLKQLKVFWGFY